jgi:transposase
VPTSVAAPALEVTDEERAELVRLSRSTSLPHRTVVQAKALLMAADGVANEEIARRSEVDSDAVRRWRKRFSEKGPAGVGVIAKGRGRKPSLPEGTVAEVLRATLHETPADGSTHWTTRTMAARVGIGKDSVARIWSDHNLKPWKVDTFKISNDPDFEAKLVDVVGLYVNPPARAVVFSFDEKTQCQALDRTQPSLPLKPGRAGTMTHDYKRHGTIDLFAAMNLATGEVLTGLAKRHTAADVLRFFKQIDATVPRGLAVHVVLDNLSAHSAPAIARWLAHRPDLQLLDESDRALVQGTDRQTPASWKVHQRRRPHRGDHNLGRPLEHRPQGLRLESNRRRDHRQGPARPRDPPPDQITTDH